MSDGYLVLDYTDFPEKLEDQRVYNGEPIAEVVYTVKALSEIIDKAHREDRKIVVCQVGECLLDWS